MTNTSDDDLVHIEKCGDAYTDDKLSSTTPLLDENRNHWEGDLEEIYLGQVDKEIKEEDREDQKHLSSSASCLSKMSTIRSFLQSRKQYLPTALLLMCVTIYLPYSYVSVLHAREQHLNELRMTSGFQKVVNRSHVLFSAYLDDRFPREPAKLRILGFKSKKDKRPLYCKVYLKDGTAVCLSNPAIELQLDPKDDRSLDTECFFHCTLPDHMSESPVAVTLTSSPKCQTQDHVVPVSLVQGDPNKKKDIVVCFSMPAGEFQGEQNHRTLIEILELSRYFGAESVQMYNESMDHILQRILAPYLMTGFLTLHPWNMGDRYLPHAARTLSINDCIYRNVAKFYNIMFVDRDEIILPSRGYNSSWVNLARQMRQVYPSSGAFWFQQVQYVSQEALPKGTSPKSLPAHCALNLIPVKQLPRIFTHRFVTRPKRNKNNKPKYSQVMLDPSVVLYVDTDMRVSFLPGKSARYLATEVGQSVRFVKYKEMDMVKDMETMETYRSNYNVELTKALYNRLGYRKRLDLSGCSTR